MTKVPPYLAQRLLLRFLRNDLAEEVLGDLDEKFYVTSKERSAFRAKVNYWYQVFNYLRPFAMRKSRSVHLNQFDMLENYFKISFRNILKYKLFSAINLFGLALAMSVCMLIMLMIADQKSYDRFHKKKDKTYRILSQRPGSSKPNASSPFPLASTLKSVYPVVEETTTLTLGVGGDATYQQRTVQMRGYFAEPSFFSVFSYALEKGNKSRALELANSIVITSEFSRMLFRDEDPIGKTIEFIDRGLGIINMIGKESPPVSWGAYTVTGVIADAGYKSHLKFDVLVSSASMKALQDEQKIKDISRDWTTYSKNFTYVVLATGKNEHDLHLALHDIATRKYNDIEHLKGFKLIEQKLTNITPGIFVGNPSSLSLPAEVYYYLSILAIIIMLSACLNYIYLSTARSLIRAKEIGIRKVAGAARRSLIYQFLSESIVTALLAMVISVGLVFLFLKSAFLNLWINKHLNFDLRLDITVFVVFIAFAILIGFIAGGYPALYLSRYKPIAALKGAEIHRPGKFRFGMMKVLNISQFIVSLLFITSSILIYNQFKHFLEFEYEFNPRQIVNIPLQGNTYQVLTHELASVPGVSGISACSFIPATGMAHGANVRKMGSDSEFIQSEILQVDENFFDNLELKLMAGKNLPVYKESSDRFIVVNAAMTEALGYKHPPEIVGQELEFGGRALQVIGVVEDFRFQTLMAKDKVSPLFLVNQPDKFNFINVRIDAQDVTTTVEALGEKWRRIDPVHSFTYRFYDQELKHANQAFGDVLSIIGYISILAIAIACLGVFGMASYTTRRRAKEVSVRKVLGAGEFGIALLLSKEFLIILGISLSIAAPLSYLINNAWLESFPNRVEFGVGTVMLGSVISIVLGLITIGSQTFYAAKRNPVDVLKSE